MTYIPVAEQKAIAEKAAEDKRVALNALFAKNRIFAFNCGKPRDPLYPEVREANPLQKQLIAAWENPAYKVFTYLGANRIGKCVTYDTLIDTPKGEVSVGELYERGEEFDVWAWDEKLQQKVKGKASAPFKKEGLHQCYRIVMTDGRWVEAADYHRILCSDGQYHNVATLAALFPPSSHDTCASSRSLRPLPLCPPVSSSERDLSNQLRDVQHLFETPLGCQDDYSAGCRQCDAPLPFSPKGDLASPPLQDGVQPCNCRESGSGVQPYKHSDNLSTDESPPSIRCGDPRFEGQCAEFLPPSSCNTSQRHLCLCQEVQQFSSASTAPPQSCEVSLTPLHPVSGCSDNTMCSPCLAPLYSELNSISYITPIDISKEVFDFSVDVYENYFAGGLIHHNTTIGAIIAISTTAGEWPWSGKKLYFPHDLPRKIRYVGQGWESHVKTVVEPALKFWWPESYLLQTKKNNQGVDATWNLLNRSHHGDRILGTIEIMSNSQDSSMFEGWHGDLVIYDEPPKRDVRIAAARGLIDRNGRELFCCTLLSEAWLHRDVIKATLPNGEPDLTIFNISGDIYNNVGFGITKEGIDQFAKMLTDDEKQARIMGKPSYMTALVCPKFDRHQHIKERFKVPLDAIIDISIDWHPSKPLAVVFLATLKNGVKYIVDEIKFRGPTKSAAEEIIRIIRMRDYARVNRIVIDPLSKSGSPNETDAYTIFAEVFAAYGYCLDVASKDKDNGIELLNGLLWTENEAPALFFFKDCVESLREIEDMMYDDNYKPVKMNDDYFECIYRLCLMDTQWFPIYESRSTGSHNVVL